MNRRRLFLTIAAATAAAWAGRGWAQAARGPQRVGLLSGGSDPRKNIRWAEFFAAMRRLGYEEGRNVTYEMRFADGEPERLRQLARNLVATKPELIVVTGSTEAVAARDATTAIPIVTIQAGDLVAARLATSLSRPGGNVTGLTSNMPGFYEKRLQLLREALPFAKRIGVLGNPDAAAYPDFRRESERAAASLGVALLPTAAAARPGELAAAFARLKKVQPQAMLVQNDVLFFVHRQRVIEFAAQARLPVMYCFTEDVEAGGLMAYAVDYRDLYARVPVIVDKILKGARPADIPIEQPTRFGLWINMKTAKALGITIPQSILVRADKVIE